VAPEQYGMNDELEQALLIEFAPTFMVSVHGCSGLPAQFAQNLDTPTVEAADGTQLFPGKSSGGGLPTAEIHFYHLWDVTADLTSIISTRSTWQYW
jgi:hypothetical protein